MMQQRAIFVDRDGVINQNRADHVKTWSEFSFEWGALDGLVKLAGLPLHLPIIVITNQGAIGRGLTTCESVDEIHRRMIIAVQQAGGRIDGVLVCPHHPNENCSCRKPKPGMLLDAASRWNIDLTRSFLIGDAATDLEVGWAVGCQTALVKTGRGAEQLARLQGLGKTGFQIAEDLTDAAHWVSNQLAYERLEDSLKQAVPEFAIEPA
jgi:D-glycero-D-manno-heptose 1,7-bisphosphate phosphatase